ncbi:MAG: BamA/TamA family outer membrane protein [bacterium]
MLKIVLVFLIVFMPFLTLADDNPEDISNNLRIDSLYINGDIISANKVDLPFDQTSVNRTINSFLKPYQDSGYYYASLEIEQIEKDNKSVILHLNFLKGPLLKIGAIVIDGLRRTNVNTIKRYIAISKSDTLNNELLERSDFAARQIDYIRYIPPIDVIPRPGFTEADLLFRFEEIKPVSIIAGGGYLPDKKTMIWNLDLRLNNLFGSGRKVSFKSEKKEKGHNILELYYRQFVFNKGFSTVEFTTSTRDYRDQFYEFSIESKLRVLLSRRLHSGIGLGYRSVEPVESDLSYSSFSTYSANFTISSDNLIDKYNPYQGYAFDWTIKYTYRKYNDDSLQFENGLLSSYNDTRLNIKMDWYQTIISDLMIRSGLKYFGLETAEELPPVSELYFVGGPGSIRGFRSEQFTALRTAIFTIEPRFRFNAGNLFLFYDGAYINNRLVDSEAGIKTEEDFYQGFGFGITLHDSYRFVKLSFGWNRDLPFDQPYLSIELSTDI